MRGMQSGMQFALPKWTAAFRKEFGLKEPMRFITPDEAMAIAIALAQQAEMETISAFQIRVANQTQI